MRRFAAELIDAEDEDAAHAAITDALIALAEPFEKCWVVMAGEGWPVLEPESGNIFAELDWSSLMDYGRHARLAAATGWWMTDTGAGEYGRDHLEIALARTTDARMRARCLQALGTLGPARTRTRPGCLDAADAWHDLGDVDGEFYSAIYGASLYGHAREGEAEMDVVQRCAALAAATPDDVDKPVDPGRRARRGGLAARRSRPGARVVAAVAGRGRARLVAGVLDRHARGRPGARAASVRERARALWRRDGGAGAPATRRWTCSSGRRRSPLPCCTSAGCEQAATTWAVCELGFDELSWQPTGALQEWFEAVRASLDAEGTGGGTRSGRRRWGWSAGSPGSVVWPGARP